MKNTEKWVVATVSLLLAYPAWVRGGTHSGYQAPMVWLAVAALVALAATRGRVRTRNAERGTRKESNAEGGTGQAEDHVGPSGQVVNEKRQEVSGKNSAFRVPLALRSLGEAGSSAFRDPVFYLAVLFLILIGVQWGNAGRALIFDYENHEWIYGAPRIAWLPSAVEAVEAKEMLLWFFPAFTVILCVRHGLSSRSSIRLLFRIMVLNACAVGVFGIVQFLSGTSSIYWRFPLKGQFFASFGYPNHAAAFFTLLLCLSLGLCIREVAGRGMERKRKGRIILLLVCALVCLAGANLSLSRAGIVASWLCVAIAGIYAIIVAFRNLSPAMRVNLIAGVLALTVLACFAVDWAARERLGKELEETANREKVISHLCGRWWQVTSAARIWKDHPWFGRTRPT